MITFPEAHLNKFQEVSIPKARVLFERFGYKAPIGHPDNTDPNHFNTPSNLGLTPTETLAAGMRVAVRLNSQAAEAAKLAERADSPEVEKKDSSVDSLVQKKDEAVDTVETPKK